MAYSSDNLTLMSLASGVRMWHYTTTDAIAVVNTAGYFNGAIGMIGLNDLIFAVTSTGGTPAVSILYAKDVSASAIDVTDGLTVTATDTD
jgi:D-arabinose 5-phosphate isomerase GutQ